MNVVEKKVKTIITTTRKIDSWFISKYGMNLYRGCPHACVYCDGRAEKYNVKDFGSTVTVKTNAIEILQKELDPSRKPYLKKSGFIMLGGGVGDSYQPLEEKYKLTRRTLELILEKKLPVHILTKSTMVVRDLDILEKINKVSRVIISMSFSSVDDEISQLFEPGVPLPSKRLEVLKKIKEKGFSIGLFLLPVIPFITDKVELLEDVFREAKRINVDFIVFGGMTLKEGKQKNYFYNILGKYYPDLLVEYENIYHKDPGGSPSKEYIDVLYKTLSVISSEYDIPVRIPPYLYRGLLDENNLVIIILEHIDYLLKLRGRRSPYGYAAYSISKLDKPLSMIKDKLREIKGVGRVTENIILEILETGTSRYYEDLLFHRV